MLTDLEEFKRLVRALFRERLGDNVPAAYIAADLVNLDRGGKRGLVYLDGEIVVRGKEVLDGHSRLHDLSRFRVPEDARIVRVADDPVPGAIYVPEGPLPDFLVDQASSTILIGWGREGRDATLDEIRAATAAAIAELFGN